jgi:plastocyanin
MLPLPFLTFSGLFRLSSAALVALALIAGLLASGSATADGPAARWGSRGSELRATQANLAAAADSVYIDPASTTVAPGGDVTVSLMASADTVAIGAWTVDIAFDPAVLDAISCVAHPAGICNAEFNVMTVRSVGATALGLSGVVQLAQITFHGVGAGGDCSALDLTADTLVDPEGNNIVMALSGGNVCLEVIENSVFINPASATVGPGGNVTVRSWQETRRRTSEPGPLTSTSTQRCWTRSTAPLRHRPRPSAMQSSI